MLLGLFIGRLNPPHIGHTFIIDKALQENNKVLLMIGTKNYLDDKNPLSFQEIREILNCKYGNEKKLEIIELNDKPSDIVWLQDILNNLGNHIKDINFYGGDFKNDSAYKVINYYKEELKNYNINCIEVSRKNSFVEFEGNKYEISATNLRKALKNGNFKLAKKFCDETMFEKIKSYFDKK